MFSLQILGAYIVPNYCMSQTFSHIWFNAKLQIDQRTNGPVNAHLRPEIHTCTNKLVRLEWYNACI